MSNAEIRPGIRTPLIIESDKPLQMLLTDLLNDFGMGEQVTVVATSEQGKKEVTQHTSLVIIDAAYDVSEALDLIGHLREKEETKGIPIVGLSNSDNPEIKKQFLDSGAQAVINKPFDIDELETVLKNIQEAKGE